MIAPRVRKLQHDTWEVNNLLLNKQWTKDRIKKKINIFPWHKRKGRHNISKPPAEATAKWECIASKLCPIGKVWRAKTTAHCLSRSWGWENSSRPTWRYREKSRSEPRGRKKDKAHQRLANQSWRCRQTNPDVGSARTGQVTPVNKAQERKENWHFTREEVTDVAGNNCAPAGLRTWKTWVDS